MKKIVILLGFSLCSLKIFAQSYPSELKISNAENPSATVKIDYDNSDPSKNIPRIRYGGEGNGAMNGFQIQGVGNKVQLRIDENGDVLWGSQGSALRTDQGGAIELRGEGKIPYIDFINDGSTDYDMRFILRGDDILNLDGGSLGIGTINVGSHKLAVEGSIGAREVKVYSTSWADFVFEDDYVLRPLAEVEQFIQENGHLPDVPSAAEVEQEGVNVGETNALLLQKIEELTLYILQQEKRIKALETARETN